MLFKRSNAKFLVLIVGVLILLLAACQSPTEAPPEDAVAPAEATEAVAEATEAVAEEPAAPEAEAGPVERKDILILPSNVQIPAPDVWNPYIPGVFILQGMNQNMMEPLFMLNYETGQLDGWLAESFSYNDDLSEWTVVLRPGTEWSDGKPLTADDVVFTINMLKDNAPNLNWSGSVAQWVKSVEALDDRTIKFVLTGPNPRFVMENLAGTTSQAIVPLPKHVWEGKDPVTFKNEYNAETGSPVFSGPYVVKSFSPTEFIYKRNDNWWGAKTGAFNLPAPLEIHRPWVGDQATMDQMLVNNESDSGGGNTPSTNAAMMEQNPKLIPFTDKPPLGWIDPCPRMLTVNSTVAPWDKKEMRWALSYAINRQQIVDVVNEGAGATSNFIFPAYQALAPYQEAIDPIVAPIGEFNIAKSHELLEGQGYTLDEGSGKYVGPDGNPLILDIVYPPFMEPWARMVAQQLNEAGIDTALRVLEWGVFRDQTGRGQFTAATDWDGCGSVVEPWFGMQRYHKKWVNPVGTAGTEYVDNTNNAGRWVNDEYSSLIDQIGSLPVGDPAVIDLMKQAVTIWTDELPDIPLVQTPVFYLFNTTYWTNWPTADNNYIQPPGHWEQFLRQLVELKPAE
jgi:peptide/nickel transport system substrate-binding protein